MIKLTLNYQIEICIIYQLEQKRSSNNKGSEIVKEVVNVIRINDGKNVKWKYALKNKLIIFTYYLKLFLILSHTIELLYQIYLILCINSS